MDPYLHLPPAEKTRKDIWFELKSAISRGKHHAEAKRGLAGLLSQIHQPAVFDRIIGLLATLLGQLAAIYLVFFVLARLALLYDLGSLTALARATIATSLAVPFLAFACLLLYLTLAARRLFADHKAIRTTLLFACSSLFIFVAGMNLIY